MSLDAARELLACPHCGEPLAPADRAWACTSGHSFDVARQGYLNLSGGPEPANADTAAMLEARARVQASGLFGFLSRALDDVVPAGAQTLLEVGAGTGHYLAGLVESRPAARGVALDVSRAAAKRAAHAHDRVASVIADVWRGIPVRDNSLDVVLCVFAPRNLAEFARVLRPGGRVVVAAPATSHLRSLREKYGLLGVDPDKQERLLAAASGHLVHLAGVMAKSTTTAAADLVDDLIGMGPNAFHATPRAAATERLELAVRLEVFGPLRQGGA